MKYRLVYVEINNSSDVYAYCKGHNIPYSTDHPVSVEDATAMKLLFPGIILRDWDIPYGKHDGNRYE